MSKKASNPKPPLLREGSGVFDVSRDTLEKAFTEWDKRFKESPCNFESEAGKDYGQSCALYFIKIINEIKGA